MVKWLYTAAGSGTATTASSFLLDAGTYSCSIDAGGLYAENQVYLLATDSFTQQAGIPTSTIIQDVNAYGGYAPGGVGSNIYMKGIFTLGVQTRVYVIASKSAIRTNDTNGVTLNRGLTEIFAKISFTRLKA